MNEDHKTYLKDIGLSDVAIDRVKNLWELTSGINNSSLQEIFVTDLINKEGIREYKNLWFFSDKFVTECENFLTMTKFDYILSGFKYHIINFSSVDYDFDRANDESRLTTRVALDESVSMTFQSARNNCDYLMKIVKKYYVDAGNIKTIQ